MKKVLIITYYWPPSGGAGVQRWLKFVKYLREFGWEPIIFTPENPEIPASDTSLEKDIPIGTTIIKTPIWEPYSAYKKFVGRKKDDKIKTGFLAEKETPSVTENISVWIRGNLFIPDARKFWVRPSIKNLSSYLKENPVDVLISTGPPHSMHLIALGLKQKMNIPWLADFRDPWTNIDFYDDLKLTLRSDRKHHKLEKQVVETANRVLVIGNGMAEDLRNIHHRNYDIITNGYDELQAEKAAELDASFSIAHIGSMVRTRNPEIFWKALSEIVIENKTFSGDLEIKLIGQIDISVRQSIQSYKLEEFVTYTEYLSHDDVRKVQSQSQVLLLLIINTPNAKLVVTGKIFEYLNSGRPILCVGPKDGDAAHILSETQTGHTVDYNDVEDLKNTIVEYYKQYKMGILKSNGVGLKKYSRKNLTKRLAEILDEIA